MRKECMDLKTQRQTYTCEIEKDIADHSQSDTSIDNFSQDWIDHFQQPRLTIIITSTVTYQLLISFGVFLNRHKEIITTIKL